MCDVISSYHELSTVKSAICYEHSTIQVVVQSSSLLPETTGYNQSVTDCGSQRRHVVVTQQKLLILKLYLTSLRNIYTNLCVVLNEDHF